MPESRVDRASGIAELHGQICRARVYPGSINVQEVQHIAGSPRTLEYEARLKRESAGATIVRIDRAEPNKNIVRGFRAYDQMLTAHPELKGRVKFLAFLVPSRTHLRQYQRYMDEVQQTIQQVNKTHGNGAWQPIVPYMENNYAQAIAGMKLYDALLVNTLVEGMNLVAKEGPVVNGRGRRAGVVSEQRRPQPTVRRGALRGPNGHIGHLGGPLPGHYNVHCGTKAAGRNPVPLHLRQRQRQLANPPAGGCCGAAPVTRNFWNDG